MRPSRQLGLFPLVPYKAYRRSRTRDAVRIPRLRAVSQPHSMIYSSEQDLPPEPPLGCRFLESSSIRPSSEFGMRFEAWLARTDRSRVTAGAPKSPPGLLDAFFPPHRQIHRALPPCSSPGDQGIVRQVDEPHCPWTLNVRPLAVLRSFSSFSGRALRRTARR